MRRLEIGEQDLATVVPVVNEDLAALAEYRAAILD